MEIPGSFENAPVPTSQPHVHLEPPYLPQNVASMKSLNEQLINATDGLGNNLFDGNGNNIFRAFDGSLVFAGYAGLTPIIVGQPLLAYEGSGTTHTYWYGIDLW